LEPTSLGYFTRGTESLTRLAGNRHRVYEEAERVFCARLSQDNRYLGALYVKCLDASFPLRHDERTEITRIASYISIFLANAGTVPQENNDVPPNGDLKSPLIQGVGA